MCIFFLLYCGKSCLLFLLSFCQCQFNLTVAKAIKTYLSVSYNFDQDASYHAMSLFRFEVLVLHEKFLFGFVCHKYVTPFLILYPW